LFRYSAMPFRSSLSTQQCSASSHEVFFTPGNFRNSGTGRPPCLSEPARCSSEACVVSVTPRRSFADSSGSTRVKGPQELQPDLHKEVDHSVRPGL
jgi:hypothetical protein